MQKKNNCKYEKFLNGINEKGITLIALVITIIILLILAGIVINAVIGENGLISRSKSAQQDYRKEQAKEGLQLKIAELQIKIETEENRSATLADFNNLIAEDEELTFISASYKTASIEPVQGEFETIRVLYKNYIFGVDSFLKVLNVEENTQVSNVELSYEITNTQDTDENVIFTVSVKLQSDEKIVKVEYGGQILTTEPEDEVTINIEVENKVEYVLKVTTLDGKTVEKTFKINVENNLVGTNDVTKNRTLDGEISGYSYSNPIIPKGFKTVNAGDAYWGYLNDGEVIGWNKGLVIEDVNNGNQFVWIPVKDGVAENGSYAENDIDTVQFKKWCTQNTSYANTTDDSLPTGISETSQVTSYGGFYVSRYITNFEKESDKTGKIVSKSGVSLGQFNYGAANYKKYSEEMYSDNYIQSSLITGTQWDTIIRWLICTGINIEDTSFGAARSSYGSSGESDSWKTNNIYDLTGSVMTVTNEKYSNSMVVRGAYCAESSNFLKARRTGISGWGYGSRTVLNIK